MNKNEIIAKLRPLAGKYSFSVFVLFGSFANDSQSADSDIDLAFFSKKHLSVDEEQLLYEDILELLSFEKVDLINLNSHFSHVLRNEIFSKGICIYESSKGLFEDLGIKAWFDYIDFKDFYSSNEKILKKKVASL